MVLTLFSELNCGGSSVIIKDKEVNLAKAGVNFHVKVIFWNWNNSKLHHDNCYCHLAYFFHFILSVYVKETQALLLLCFDYFYNSMLEHIYICKSQIDLKPSRKAKLILSILHSQCLILKYIRIIKHISER